jgi:dTMP kinase
MKSLRPVTMNRALFITLEGGEGAGKTTLIKSLETALKHRGYDVVVTREPGGSHLGEIIREWLLKNKAGHNVGSKAELLLFLAARAQHIEELIDPALKAGKIVLCDRFNDSTIAYQSAARGLESEFVKQLCQWVCESTQPHVTFFLDVDPKIGMQRTVKRESKKSGGGADRMELEGIQFHQKVREAFVRLAEQEPQRIKRLDASQSQASVFESALGYILKIAEHEKH